MGKDKDRFDLENDSDFAKEFEGITFTYDDPENTDGFTGEFAPAPDPDEYYGRKGKKKKKKRKKKRYLLKFVIFLLAVAAVVFFLRSDFFNIEKVNVLNNDHYTEEQIIQMVGIKTGDNLFEFTARGLKKKLAEDPYIETVEVSRKLPHTLEINVKEREENIVVPYGEKFIVADYEGMVLRVADSAPDLTVVNNLEPEKPEPGSALEVKETQILTDTLNMLKDVEEVDLYFKKISVSQHSVKAYIYDNLIVEGSYDNISENLGNLSIVIDDLHKKKIKRGTIKVSGNGYCSFQPEVDSKNA